MFSPIRRGPLTVEQVADIAQVQPETVRERIKRGRAVAIQFPGGSCRVERREIARLLRRPTGERS